MLVLQRKKGQAIMLGDEIEISIMDIGADTVKLAINAPGNVKILRGELKEAAEMNQEAVAGKAQLQAIKEKLKKK